MHLYCPKKIAKALAIKTKEEIFIVSSNETEETNFFTRKQLLGEKILAQAVAYQQKQETKDYVFSFFVLTIPKTIQLKTKKIKLKYCNGNNENPLCLEVKT